MKTKICPLHTVVSNRIVEFEDILEFSFGGFVPVRTQKKEVRVNYINRKSNKNVDSLW